MNTLFLGNGFDLYHGLKTKYSDFLYVIRNIDTFKNQLDDYLSNENGDTDSYLFKDFYNEKINKKAISKMCQYLKGNPWVYYYSESKADIQGWIDFENEMNPVFDLFRKVINEKLPQEQTYYINNPQKTIRFDIYSLSQKEYAVATLWPDYFTDYSDLGKTYIYLNPKYYHESYGVLGSMIISHLEEQLNKFTLAFMIYLQEIVEKKAIIKYKWIEDLKPGRIISFNYTSVEKEYTLPNIDSYTCSHVHGTTDNANLVFGTDLIDDEDVDFLHFSKRFQRMFKVGDYSYLDYLEECDNINSLFTGQEGWESYVASFVGCSLDKNDAPIFKDYIEKADYVNVYCYGYEGYQKALTNLISVFGSDKIRDFIHVNYDGAKLEFYDIKGLSVDEEAKLINPSAFYKKSRKGVW